MGTFARAVRFGAAAFLLSSTSAHALIGGTVPPLISLPKQMAVVTMIFSDGSRCTATKVANRTFLTAAHCVLNLGTNQLASKTTAGQALHISNLSYPYATLPLLPLTVRKVVAEPRYTSACAAGACPLPTMMEAGGDIALVQVNEATPLLPAAAADLGFKNTGAAVTIIGYGCEDQIGSPMPVPGDPSLPYGRKKYHSTTLVAKEFAIALGHGTSGSFAANHMLTAGRAALPTEASLCSGDSGGPLVLNDGTDVTVVGVHSFYGGIVPAMSFGVSAFNVHSRLSAVSAWFTANLL